MKDKTVPFTMGDYISFHPRDDVFTVPVDGTYMIRGKTLKLKKGDEVDVDTGEKINDG